MGENELIKRFAAMCKLHKFTKFKTSYVRCIGDGVYQFIETGKRAYLNPCAPSYSQVCRKSRFIRMGFSSIYANLDECFFDHSVPGGLSGMVTLRPQNLRGRRPDISTFMGFQEDCQIMLDIGFDFMDSISTQERLLEVKSVRDHFESKSGRIFDLYWFAPYIICGHKSDAMAEIGVDYTHHWDWFHWQFDYLKAENKVEQYLQNEMEVVERTELSAKLWRWCLSKDNSAVHAFLQENLMRNMAWMHVANIPCLDDLAFRNTSELL